MGRYDFFCGGPCPYCNSSDISFSSKFGQKVEIQTKIFSYPSFKSYHPGDKLPILIDELSITEIVGITSCCEKYVGAIFERRSDDFTYLLKYVKIE
jgi:hypothetical protein